MKADQMGKREYRTYNVLYEEDAKSSSTVAAPCRRNAILSSIDRTAAIKSAESLFSHYPGLIDKISLEQWIVERNILQEQAFRTVEPMRGAVGLVRGLVGRP